MNSCKVLCRASESQDGPRENVFFWASMASATTTVHGAWLLLLPPPLPWTVESKPERCLVGAPGGARQAVEGSSSLVSSLFPSPSGRKSTRATGLLYWAKYNPEN